MALALPRQFGAPEVDNFDAAKIADHHESVLRAEADLESGMEMPSAYGANQPDEEALSQFAAYQAGIDPLDALLYTAPPPFSTEKEGTDTQDGFPGTDELGAEEVAGEEEAPVPSIQDEVGLGDVTDDRTKRAMEAMYGSEFPFLKENPEEDDWVSWAYALFDRHSSSVERRLHLVRRNRLMRDGDQWISAVGYGPWRQPTKPRDAARVVDNVIAPALDYRLEIVTDQRPGFQTRPLNQEQRNVKKAEAQQVAVQYQFDQQEMTKVMREAGYWAGTDGVCFIETGWDADRGPWDEVMLPHPETGEYQNHTLPMGDAYSCVHRIEEVRVSANATLNKKPWYYVVRKMIPKAQAVKEYGAKVVDGAAGTDTVDTTTMLASLEPDITALIQDQEVMDSLTVHCDKSEYLRNGITFKVVGRKLVVDPSPLLFGKIPIVPFRDGSSDPAFYPTPIMDGWIEPQMRINALKSKWVENVRLNAGAKLLARRDAISSETLVAGNMTVIEVKGAGPMDEAVKEMRGSSVGTDVKELLQLEVMKFEQLTGWNDSARGSVSSETSGRAILANREQLERVFAPTVNAASEAMAEWATVQLAVMKWGYDTPRKIAVEGTGRPDLARELSSDDFDGIAQVTVDPETLMPMPRALRLYLLDTLLEKGVIGLQEYRRRLPFAFVNNIDSPDTDQFSRANRAAEAIRNTGNPLAIPVLWQDNEAIHQDVLERELILPDDLPPQLRSAAYERWMMLAQQAMMKQATPVQGGPSGGLLPPTPGPKQTNLPPGQQPFQGTNPSIGAGTAAMMAHNPTDEGAGRVGDITSHQ